MNKGILIVMTNPPADMEEEFNAWYDTEHLPERLAVPGFERACRYYVTHAERRYLALYDTQSIEIFQSETYLATSGDKNSPWTKRIIPRCRFIRVPAVQIYPGDAVTGQAPRLLMIRFAEAAEQASGIVESAKRIFAAPQVRQLRVFTAQENGDVYVMAEGHAGLEALVRSDLFGGGAARIDLINLYASC